LVFLGLVAGQAQAAGFVSGSELLEWCSEPQDGFGGTGLCTGYVLGAQDSHGYFVNNGLFQPLYCMPKHVTPGQLLLVVKKRLQERPEDLHYAAGGLVIEAFMEAFPCK